MTNYWDDIIVNDNVACNFAGTPTKAEMLPDGVLHLLMDLSLAALRIKPRL